MQYVFVIYQGSHLFRRMKKLGQHSHLTSRSRFTPTTAASIVNRIANRVCLSDYRRTAPRSGCGRKTVATGGTS